MEQNLSLQQLAERLTYLEGEINRIQDEMASLRQQTPTRLVNVAYVWANKSAQGRWMNHLFAVLSIQGPSIGVWALQQKMGQTALTTNEMSRSLIEAREE